MDRPTKKARLQGPDGFQKPKSRYKPPESITKFVSAFDESPPVKSARPQPIDKSPPKKKPVSVVTHGRPRNPFVDFDVPREPEEAQAGPSKPLVSGRQSKPPSSAHPAMADRVLPPLKVLKPPVLLPPPVADATVSNIHPLMLKPTEKPRSILKPPPVPIPPTTKPLVSLKPLAPPPLPEHRPTSPKKVMKTIFTTHVAQATDPTKEGTGAELLSLFLQQHGHTFTSSTDRELQRGVMVSPDKRSRGKDPKFIRYVPAPASIFRSSLIPLATSGGLAERIQHRISCTKTDFALWRRQMEQKIESGSKLSSDMRLRILRVLDVAKPSEQRSRFVIGPRSGLALCRLMRRHALAGGDLTLGTYVVVFHFAPTHGGGRSAVSTTERFEEGNEVMAWLPWQKVDLSGVEGCASLLEMFRALDALTPPHSLLVLSRFCFVT